MTPEEALPPRLKEIVEDFALCEGREKLELLIQYAESLPPLPRWLEEQRGRMESIPECMTAVFVFTKVENGRMDFFFDVPEEAPTVRGYAALMAQGLQGAAPEEVLAIPSDFYLRMGLQDVLSMQRMNGIAAIVAHVKRLAVEHLHPEKAKPIK